MKIRSRMSGLALVAAALLVAPAAGDGEVSLVQRVDTLQEKVDAYLAQDREGESRGDREYAELIERLELGMSALEELGEEEALHDLQRIADEVRRERRAARGAPRRGREKVEERRGRDPARSEVDVVRERLKVMRLAVDAYLEAEEVAAAERVEQAMHARELAIERRRDPRATRIREAAPEREELAGLLKRAAHLWAEWGHERKAAALSELARTYAEQARRGQRGARERERAPGRLDDLETRLEIVRHARGAHAEAGHAEAREILERLLAVGELQGEGADPESIARAAEGLSMGEIIELLQGAAGLCGKWEKPERARACAQLAEFYARRERERTGDEEGGRLEDLERREREVREALQQIRPKHPRYQFLQEQLEELERQGRAAEAAEEEPAVTRRRLADHDGEADREAMMRRLAGRVEKLQAELNEVKQVLRQLHGERR